MGISISPTAGYAVNAHLTDLELATIRSALRCWQIELENETHNPELVDESIGTLTAEEIGDLLYRLNHA